MVKERGKEVNISKYITTDQKEPMEREKEKKKISTQYSTGWAAFEKLKLAV